MATKKTAAKKTAAKKTVAKKTVAKKTAAKKTAAKKTAAKKTAAKKTAAKKTVAKKTVAKKTVAKKTVAKRARAEREPTFPVGEMLTMEAEIPAPPARVYAAWLDAKEHSAMTGATASSQPREGGAFTAWDGYIQGRYLGFVPGERIVASWRTTEFAADDPDSQLDLHFGAHRVDGKAGTRLFLIHTGLPSGGASKYAAGWAQYYFAPMSDHFTA